MNLNQLGPASRSTQDVDGPPRYTERRRQDVDQRGIRSAFDRRRVDLDLDGIAVATEDAVLTGARLETDLQAPRARLRGHTLPNGKGQVA
jgi:hypothetical protein